MVDTQCLDKRLERLLGGATLALFLAGLLVVAGLPSGRLMLDVYSLERHGDSVELNDRGEVYYVFLNEAREQLPDVSVWPTLRTLTCSDQIEDLRGIGVCPNVDSLSVPAVSSACHDQFPNLKWLGVGSAYPLSDLRSAKQVETLHLSGQDLSALPTLPTLRQLFLDECKVHSVPSLPQLDVLHMSDCDVDLTSGWDAAWELSGLYISNSSVKGCLSCKRPVAVRSWEPPRRNSSAV